MAAPRLAYLVHLSGAPPVLVLSERDAKTYPGRTGVQPIVVHRGDGGTADLPQFYALDPLRHAYAEAPPLVFDRLAADARKAVRDAALAKLTQSEREALVGTGPDT
jgi:hypothetical protein